MQLDAADTAAAVAAGAAAPSAVESAAPLRPVVSQGVLKSSRLVQPSEEIQK